MATLGDTSNYRTILQRYNCKLAENIDAKVILPYMRDFIDSYQIDQVYREENTFKQNEKLLTVVSKAGPNGFLSFMKALDVSYPHLAAQIRQEKRNVTEAKPVSRLHRRIAKQQGRNTDQKGAFLTGLCIFPATPQMTKFYDRSVRYIEKQQMKY